MATTEHPEPRPEEAALASVLDALPLAAALLDGDGRIGLVNRLWRDGDGFIGSNLAPGADYVEACRRAGAATLAEHIVEILAGTRALAIGAAATPHAASRCFVARLGPPAPFIAAVLCPVPEPAPARNGIEGIAQDVAHDLTNLLIGMAGVLDAAFAESEAESAAAPRLRAARLAVDHAGALVGQLLAYVRRDLAAHREIDLAETVGQALDLLAAALPAHIVLERALAPGMPAHADPVQLHQLVLNLGSNAAEAIGAAPGRIAVRLERLPAASVPAGLAPIPYARLSVEDDGPGIPPEIVGRVFEPFFTTKPPGRGTGLGLAIVQRIVRDHCGRIELRSAPGAGTSVTIFLPLAHGPGAP